VSDLKRVKACVFDAYGTLFDFASAAAACTAAPADRRAALAALWRDKQLQYSWLRSLQGRYVDFWNVTSDALDYALDSLGLADTALRDQLMALYRRLSAFPEVPATLRALRGAGYAAGLDGLFDGVLSVDALRVFKTDPRVYQYALDRLGFAANEVAFLSSNGWDAYAASDFGLSVVWCNRYRQPRERLPGAPDFEIHSLAELPPLLGIG
jgi:2-haloacid dehalogenase